MPSLADYRQRWRFVFARRAEADSLLHRDFARLLEEGLASSELAARDPEGVSPRLAFAAPLPAGIVAERELADVFLSERATLTSFREVLGGILPAGYHLVDAYDVWLGEPALAGQVVASDYCLDLSGPSAAEIEMAVHDLLAADTIERIGRKEGKAAGNLRPLLLGLSVVRWLDASRGPQAEGELWTRLRHSQESGNGRPEEVIAALDRIAPTPCVTERIIRERVWLGDELRPLDQTRASEPAVSRVG